MIRFWIFLTQMARTMQVPEEAELPPLEEPSQGREEEEEEEGLDPNSLHEERLLKRLKNKEKLKRILLIKKLRELQEKKDKDEDEENEEESDENAGEDGRSRLGRRLPMAIYGNYWCSPQGRGRRPSGGWGGGRRRNSGPPGTPWSCTLRPTTATTPSCTAWHCRCATRRASASADASADKEASRLLPLRRLLSLRLRCRRRRRRRRRRRGSRRRSRRNGSGRTAESVLLLLLRPRLWSIRPRALEGATSPRRPASTT